MSKFKLGDKVVEDFDSYNEDGEYPLDLTGTVLSVLTETSYVVEWDYDNSQVVVAEEKLLSEKEAKSKWNRLEREFTKLENQIVNKMEKAGQLIAEADALANAKNIDLIEMYDAVRPLMRAMNEAGWNTSSLRC